MTTTAPELSVIPGGKPSDQATAALVAILSEQRKLNERMFAHAETAWRRLESQNDMLQAQVKVSYETTERALKMQVELAAQHENLLSQRHERDLASSLAQQKQSMIADLMSSLQALVPLGAKQLMGIKLTGNDSHGLQDLLKAFTPEQIEELVTTGKLTLNDAQRMLLVAIFQDLAEQERKRQEAQQQATQPQAAAESDSAK